MYVHVFVLVAGYNSYCSFDALKLQVGNFELIDEAKSRYCSTVAVTTVAFVLLAHGSHGKKARFESQNSLLSRVRVSSWS